MSALVTWLRDPNPQSRGQARLGQAYLSWLRFRRNPLAMIGLVRDVAGEVIALHRTYLQQDGDTVRKADVPKPRMMMGKVGGGAAPNGGDDDDVPF